MVRLIKQFERLSDTGYKNAQRLAYYVLGLPREEAERFTRTIREAHEKIHCCKECCNLTGQEFCPVCHSTGRGRLITCVVESPRDIFTLERTSEYKGLYHVLHGMISPPNGTGPDQLYIKELLAHMDNEVEEIIVVTNSTVEGEVTAMHLSHLLKPMGITVTHLIHGTPVGGDLEHADEMTLTRAMESRRET